LRLLPLELASEDSFRLLLVLGLIDLRGGNRVTVGATCNKTPGRARDPGHLTFGALLAGANATPSAWWDRCKEATRAGDDDGDVHLAAALEQQWPPARAASGRRPF